MTAELVAIDIETKDPDLKTKGVGVRRKDGHIVGVAIGWKTGQEITSRYFNLRHLDCPSQQKELMFELNKIIASKVPITGANLLYDFDWIAGELGVTFENNPWQDVQVAEPLIDENAKGYSLNALAGKYPGETKTDGNLYQYCQSQFGGKADRSQAKNIWRCPFSMVEQYALGDVELPLKIHAIQLKIIKEQNLFEVWQTECDLQPVLLGMKRRGVRVDVERAFEMGDRFQMMFDQQMNILKNLNNGVYVEVWASKSLSKLFEKLGLEYPRTLAGNPSFTKAFLNGHRHPCAKAIVRAREFDKLRSTFLENAILGNQINGRIHCQFNQLKGDEYGTVTGRLSSSLPNLQQVPARSEMGKKIRALFVPEDGQRWGKADYSQIEPRLLLSYAPKRDVNQIVNAYASNPAMSCYRALQEGMEGVSYSAVKAIYLGATYGMGKETMAHNLGCTVEDAEPQFRAFHDGAPYIRRTSNMCMAKAEENGQIRTVGGRICRFPLYEPSEYSKDKKPALPYEQAVEAYGTVKRAFVYKALNKLIQGGAADIMKKAMIAAHKEGLFNEDKLGFPLLTVHDELDVSFHDKNHLVKLGEVMESVFEEKLRVKMRVDVEIGPNWGEVV